MLWVVLWACAGKGDCTLWERFADDDGDGYGAGTATEVCDDEPGFVSNATDCDDGDADIHPFASFICGSTGDVDCDGVDDANDADGDAWPACNDCNDADPAIHPEAQEICSYEQVDEDCDGLVDDDDTDPHDTLTMYVDADADGYGDWGEVVQRCHGDTNFASEAGDCDDTDAAAYPGADEICEDAVDQDCDGTDVTCGVEIDDLLKLTGASDSATGSSVAGGGDLDGDGLPDLVAGCPFHGADAEIRIVAGPVDGNADIADVSFAAIVATPGGDWEASDSGASIGDVNGDGADDLLTDKVGMGEGGSDVHGYLFYGPLTGETAVEDADVAYAGTLDGDPLSSIIAGGVDLSGDGAIDVAIGFPNQRTSGSTYGGGVFVHDAALGTPLAFLSGSTESLCGAHIDAGDVDGDGVGDLVVGSNSYAWLFLGPIGDMLLDHDADTNFYGGGNAVLKLLVNTDGDGATDIAILPGDDAVYVMPGTLRGIKDVVDDAQAILQGEEEAGAIGAFDQDGDGVQDAVVGMPNCGSSDPGVTVLVMGPLEGTVSLDPTQGAHLIESREDDSCFGSSIAVLGDQDGDGAAEVAIGAPGDTISYGAAYVVPSSLW